LPKQASLVDVSILKIDAHEAESEDNWELAEQLWTRVLIVSPGDQQAIKAIKRVAIKSASMPSSPTSPAANPAVAGRSTSAPIENPPITPTPPPNPTIPSFAFEVITVDAQGREVKRDRRQAQYFTEDLGSDVVLEMVSIPGGTFQMGSPDGEGYDNEHPQHPVTVKPFLMSKYPVTQAQWQVVAALPKISHALKPDPSGFKGASHPVEIVSWHDAVECCARLSKETGHDYRLPTEAEWEYACRAGTTSPVHFGETITTGLANYRRTDWEHGDTTYPGNYGDEPKGIYREQTTDVGSFPPNAFGLYDMHGNVWEWCLDHWHKNYGGFLGKAPSDGSAWIKDGDSTRRLLRGGSWCIDPRVCRSANRFRNEPDGRNNNIGFRVVCASAWTF
jgi:formylglycine-generating enzyme required for sulfatase activity